MIYLDNSATTIACDECVSAVTEMLKSNYGNPSSLHGVGIDAFKAVAQARQAVADEIGADPSEIYFTSGGTESNNLAIFSAAKANGKRGRRIVTTAIEHESVLMPIKELEQEGFEVIYLTPDDKGRISQSQITDAINKDTILVSIMLVNNEVGSILPVKAARKAIDKTGAPAYLHVDCVQAFGKIPVKVKSLGADMITVTAHKIHGAKGCGALYIGKSVKNIKPRTFGGEQEKRVRPGTEASPLIAGFGAAVKALPNFDEAYDKVKHLSLYAKEKLGGIPGVVFNSGEDALPYIINIAVPTFMMSQTIIQELHSKYSICVSSGSACAKGKKSHVLTAMKIQPRLIDRSIRISFSRYNTTADIDSLVSALKELISTHPMNKQ